MILYVNGDSHAAAAEAVNQHAFAEDDPNLFYMGRAPHPANLAVSWGRLLSEKLKATFVCQAESASSNDRIIRTTRQWINEHENDWHRTLIVISWSTWEREEWLIDGTYYQINASGLDDVPESHRQHYKEFVASVDWKTVTEKAHEDIWQFHQELESKGIQHIFFNGNNDFSKIKNQQQWGHYYIDPYDPAQTYDQLVKQAGFQTVGPDSWHYGASAHNWWSKFLLKYIIDHDMV